MAYNVNESDLAQRLHGKYVLYKGVPYYGQSVSRARRTSDGNIEYCLYGYKVGQESAEAVKLDPLEPTFSQTAVMFGYCYDQNGSLAYLEPNYSNDGYGLLKIMWSNQPRDRFCTPHHKSKLMADCINGRHGTFKEAVEKLKSQRSVAFDRHFALDTEFGFSDVSIRYKGKVIGYYNKKDGKVRLRSGPMMKLIKRKLDKLMEN